MKQYISLNDAIQAARPEGLNENRDDKELAIYAKGWNACMLTYVDNLCELPTVGIQTEQERKYQPKPDGNHGYQPVNNSTTPPAPPTSGSNLTPSLSMDIKEAIEVLKSNYPDAHYSMVREAVDIAIAAMEEQMSSHPYTGRGE